MNFVEKSFTCVDQKQDTNIQANKAYPINSGKTLNQLKQTE